MSYGRMIMKFPIFFLLNFAFLRTNGEVVYVPKITDSIFSCEDFDNDLMNCDGLKLGSEKGDDGDDTAQLAGQIKTFGDLTSDYEIEINIWKVLDMGDEYMYNMRCNFCSSLESEDSPWYPMVKELGIEGCPVPSNTFEINNMTVSLDAVKDVMCHDFCGAYRIHVSFVDKTEQLSCHVIELSIVEQNDD